MSLTMEDLAVFFGYFGHLLYYLAVLQLGNLYLGKDRRKVRCRFPAFFAAAAAALLLRIVLLPSVHLLPEGELRLALTAVQQLLQIGVLPLWWLGIFFRPLHSIAAAYISSLPRRLWDWVKKDWDTPRKKEKKPPV